MNQISVNPKLRKQALKHLDAAAMLDLPKDVLESIKEAQQRLQMPLAEILSRVPGESVVERAKYLGIARQTYYQWLRGAARPNAAQAANLARLTGIDVHKIRGRTTTTTAPVSEQSAAISAA